MQNNDFFNVKIEQIIECVFLLQPTLNKEKLRKGIIQAYERYGINKNKESLYDMQGENNLYIKPKYKRRFPTIKELYDILKEQDASNGK